MLRNISYDRQALPNRWDELINLTIMPSALPYAFSGPPATGKIKVKPEDFITLPAGTYATVVLREIAAVEGSLDNAN